jgi:hypothetical protein
MPPPPGIAGAAFFSGISATIASVVTRTGDRYRALQRPAHNLVGSMRNFIESLLGIGANTGSRSRDLSEEARQNHFCHVMKKLN